MQLTDAESLMSFGNGPVVQSKNLFKPLRGTEAFHMENAISVQGIGMTLDPANEFVFPILHGEISTQSQPID
jgi:hypothetical protein